ncbi:murein hydrolase activator EnvC family protein [Oceanibacterium hippocampi]|uniref:murein hydrolase activator EnvC family protein n=1 Tax=Oceanibacterium hippocampi TaxID=745714 RepID=UPI001592D58E|nr:peptidoglycan DD-metalloendopeptidase family protein [Oceanibacterium hippocampi]
MREAISEGESRDAALKARAEEIRRELDDLRRQSVAAVASAREADARLDLLERELEAIASVEAETIRDLGAREQQAASTVAAMIRLRRRPPESMIAHPQSLADSFRSSRLMAAIFPVIRDDATALSEQLDSLRELREQRITTFERQRAARDALAAEQAQVNRLVALKSGLEAELARQRGETRGRLASLAEKAENLQDLIARLEAEAREREIARKKAEALAMARQAARPVPRTGPGDDAGQAARDEAPLAPRAARPLPSAPQSAAFATVRGRLPLPVPGRIVRMFGRPTVGGESPLASDKGIGVAARPSAIVAAPYDGEIVFAGPFRKYGLLLIIAHGDGYHSLIAGISRIDGTVGQRLLAGEPVAQMASDTATQPILYFELRRNGAPINPLPWLAARENEVSG